MQLDLNDPQEFTIEGVRRLIASGSDRTHSQLRVTKAGHAFLSKTIDSEDTEHLAFRLEPFSMFSGHVGQEAAQDDAWVKKIFNVLKSNWPNPPSEYIDDF